MIKIDVMCHICVYAMYVCMPWCMCVYVLYVCCMCVYVLYVCCMCAVCVLYVCICVLYVCCMCAMCVLWSAMMCVCQVCVSSNRCVCAKTSGNQQKCPNRESMPKHVKSREISEIHENPWKPLKTGVYYRPLYTTFHFANDRPSGGPILGFRCTTPHETVLFCRANLDHTPFFALFVFSGLRSGA